MIVLPSQVGRKPQAVCINDCITVAGGEKTTADALHKQFGPEVQAGNQLFLESTVQTATSGMSTLSLTLLEQLVTPRFAGCAMACWLHRGMLVTPWRVGYIVACWLRHGALVTSWHAGYVMTCWLHRGVSVTPWRVGYIVGWGYAMTCWLHRGQSCFQAVTGRMSFFPLFYYLFYHCDCVGYIMVSSFFF